MTRLPENRKATQRLRVLRALKDLPEDIAMGALLPHPAPPFVGTGGPVKDRMKEATAFWASFRDELKNLRREEWCGFQFWAFVLSMEHEDQSVLRSFGIDATYCMAPRYLPTAPRHDSLSALESTEIDHRLSCLMVWQPLALVAEAFYIGQEKERHRQQPLPEARQWWQARQTKMFDVLVDAHKDVNAKFQDLAIKTADDEGIREQSTYLLGGLVAAHTTTDGFMRRELSLNILAGENSPEARRIQKLNDLPGVVTSALHPVPYTPPDPEDPYPEQKPEFYSWDRRLGFRDLVRSCMYVIDNVWNPKIADLTPEETFQDLDERRRGEGDDDSAFEEAAARNDLEAAFNELELVMNRAKLSQQQRRIVKAVRNDPDSLLAPNNDIRAEEVSRVLDIPSNQVSVQWRRIKAKAREVGR